MRVHTTGRAALRYHARQAELHEREMVRVAVAARAQGVTWREIGMVLGLTAQAAHSRFGRAERDGTEPAAVVRW